MKVLIVDDSTYIRSTIRNTLEQHGFEIVGEAGNGEKAIDLALELDPDIITLDNILPDMTGIDVLKTLDQSNHHSYVVMISAVGQQSSQQEAYDLGAKHYLIKPFDHNKLVSILKTVEPK